MPGAGTPSREAALLALSLQRHGLRPTVAEVKAREAIAAAQGSGAVRRSAHLGEAFCFESVLRNAACAAAARCAAALSGSDTADVPRTRLSGHSDDVLALWKQLQALNSNVSARSRRFAAHARCETALGDHFSSAKAPQVDRSQPILLHASHSL
jgi:hypothetical protein